MKILFVNHALDFYAGTETFTYSLAVELRRQGHEVICFSRHLGRLAERLRDGSIRVTNDLASVDENIDLIHSHHRYESFLAYTRFPRKPMILVCHGVVPWQEQPLRCRMNIYRYIAVSEEVKSHLVDLNYSTIAPHEVDIVRNGIDTTRFYCRRPIEAVPKRALLLSNYLPEKQLSLLHKVCNQLGIELTVIGRLGQSIWNVEDYINEADVVFSLGRGVLEAAACKRVVIVYGYDGSDGLVTPENVYFLRERNFSGRTKRIDFSEKALLDEVGKYDRATADKVFEYIYPDHDIHTIVARYLEIYKRALDHCGDNPQSNPFYPMMEELLADIEVGVKGREAEITALRDQLSMLHEHAHRLQLFADAVRHTWAYRFYRNFIKPRLLN